MGKIKIFFLFILIGQFFGLQGSTLNTLPIKRLDLSFFQSEEKQTEEIIIFLKKIKNLNKSIHFTGYEKHEYLNAFDRKECNYRKVDMVVSPLELAAWIKDPELVEKLLTRMITLNSLKDKDDFARLLNHIIAKGIEGCERDKFWIQRSKDNIENQQSYSDTPGASIWHERLRPFIELERECIRKITGFRKILNRFEAEKETSVKLDAEVDEEIKKMHYFGNVVLPKSPIVQINKITAGSGCC